MNGIDLYDGITLHQGDCRDIMRTYPDQHFDAVITDPPYGISIKGEKWDTATPHGFQAWAQSWGEEALRVLKPGGYLLAFSAPRTYHRLTSGLEDAGFEVRDAMAWIRADGKPAGMDLSSAFDRAAGVLDKREGRDVREWADENTATHMSSHKLHATGKPVTDEAKAWEGWGLGLKPAWEPIIVARRPLDGTLVNNVREHGTGAMNIRAVMDAANGSYPPESTHGRTSHGRRRGAGSARPRVASVPLPAEGPHKRTPKGGGGTARHGEAARAHAVPGESSCAPWVADPRTIRRVRHDSAGGRPRKHARGRLRTRRPIHPTHQRTLQARHRSTPRPVRTGR